MQIEVDTPEMARLLSWWAESLAKAQKAEADFEHGKLNEIARAVRTGLAMPRADRKPRDELEKNGKIIWEQSRRAAVLVDTINQHHRNAQTAALSILVLRGSPF